MAFTLTVQLDPTALAKAQKLASWQPVLEQHLIQAFNTSLTTMQEYAVGFCFSNFMNPLGGLEGQFGTSVVGGMPVTGMLFNDSPYGYRREYGFVGLTDSLGRVGTDKGIKYMDNTLQANTQVIYENVLVEVQAAFAELGV